LAGFQVTIIGRFWVTAEAGGRWEEFTRLAFCFQACLLAGQPYTVPLE
jgi:hypothetical protein